MNGKEREDAINRLSKVRELLSHFLWMTSMRWNTPSDAITALDKVIHELSPDTICPICNGETIIDVTDGGATPCPLCTDLHHSDENNYLPPF